MKGFLKVSIISVLLLNSVSSCVYQDSGDILVSEPELLTKTREKDNYYLGWLAGYENYDLKEIMQEEYIHGIDYKFSTEQSSQEVKGNPIYVHYMPWFQTKKIDGFWGQHWTMTNRNPERFNSDGEREIASHYYPLIGPYATKDKTLQQYHLLLMKLSGVDGIIFDWYGIRDILDFKYIRESVDSFLLELEKTNIKFAIMYEDRVVKEQARNLTQIQIDQAKNDLLYIKNKYFSKQQYITVKDKKLLMIFGPNFINQKGDWTKILKSMKNETSILSLWKTKDIIGEENSSGEYAWIDKNHTETLYGFYNYGINFNSNIIGGVTYPRFNDFYKEGGWRSLQEDEWELDGRGTKTFTESYQESVNHPIDFMQIATWNDFGEGTMIEPTKDFGFNHLEKLQEFTQVNYKKSDLRLPYYIYQLKKQFPKEYCVQFLTAKAYEHAMNGRLDRAKFLIGLLMLKYTIPLA